MNGLRWVWAPVSWRSGSKLASQRYHSRQRHHQGPFGHLHRRRIRHAPGAPATEPARLTGALVRFTPGARTFWHSHERGQTLYVTEGVGLVTGRDGTVTRIRPGDTVTVSAGEEHWHGGTATTCMSSHLALVTAVGEADPTAWLEAVTEEEYAAAQQV